MMTLEDLFLHLTHLMTASAAIRDPKRAARWIIADTCGLDLSAQLAHPDHTVPEDRAARAIDWARRHAAGEPLSRLRGKAVFYDLEFALSPDTLDPRPETEMIVRTVLEILGILPLKGGGARLEAGGGGDTHITSNIPPTNITPTLTLPPSGGGNTTGLFHQDDFSKTISLLDLGTGTGCIPIAILKHAPHVQATAVDIAEGALQTARQNARTNHVDDRMRFVVSNWYESLGPTCLPPLPGPFRGGSHPFDIITANPPYIPRADIETLDPAVRFHDPIRALDGGATGLDPYEILIAGLDTHLAPDGIALFEIGIGQAPDVQRLVEKYGLDAHPPIVDDGGIPRVICVTRPTKK